MWTEKYKTIYKLIESFDTIVIARHVGVDPDAMSSQLALRDSILKTFPNKTVLAVGSGSVKFTYLGKLDKLKDDIHDALLFVLDTPDQKRVDGISNFDVFVKKVKMDHHPFMEEFCDIEVINDKSSSASEIVLDFIKETGLVLDTSIAEKLFIGLASDTNRFMFNSSKDTFWKVAELLETYNLDISSLYEKLYLRPINEVRLQGYIGENMIITEHGVGYVKITNDTITKFQADVSSAGNMVNNFNYIDGVYVWITMTEDVKNNLIKANIRSRGPIINTVAEHYHGGGHKFASGARVFSWEEADALIRDLDTASKEFLVHQRSDEE